MISFLIETSIILSLVYVFYYFVLRKSRSFVFIRMYFLLAICFALLMPFIELPVQNRLPVLSDDLSLHFASLEKMEGGENILAEESSLTLRSFLLWVYFMGLGVMFFRFFRNLIRMLMKLKPEHTVKWNDFSINLIDDESLPYSFFGHIYLNRLTYEQGDVSEDLLIHEEAHCKQYHSLDVMLAEMMKIILWFNPFTWLIEKAIRLNHEYLADAEVLSSRSKDEYQLLLITLALGNQPLKLASAFNTSFTKQRLAMMNIINQGKKDVFRKLFVIPLFLILVLGLSYCEVDQTTQENPEITMEFYANDWWKPILEKHQITPRAYNNFEFIFEMGSTNSIDENRIVTLDDAFFLLRKDASSYAILRSPRATHDLETDVISGASGTMEIYNLLQEDLEPESKIEMENFKYRLFQNNYSVSADYIVLYEQGKEPIKGWTAAYEARDSLVIERME